MVLVQDTSSQCALQMYEVSSKYFNCYQVIIEWTRFCEDRQTDARGKTICLTTLEGG